MAIAAASIAVAEKIVAKPPKVKAVLTQYRSQCTSRERAWGCDRVQGQWVCSFQTETLMVGKHPTCRCIVRRAYRHMHMVCTCNQ